MKKKFPMVIAKVLQIVFIIGYIVSDVVLNSTLTRTMDVAYWNNSYIPDILKIFALASMTAEASVRDKAKKNGEYDYIKSIGVKARAASYIAGIVFMFMLAIEATSSNGITEINSYMIIYAILGMIVVNNIFYLYYDITNEL